jgi:hypothetical protein
MQIGVLYAKAGQTKESEFYNNETGSQEFEEFLEFLGDRVPLTGWGGHIQVPVVSGFVFSTTASSPHRQQKRKSEVYCYYTEYRDFELTFHVSTLLPFSTDDDNQQVARYAL